MSKVGFVVGAVALTLSFSASARADRRPVCSGHDKTCLSYVSVDETGHPRAHPAAQQLAEMVPAEIQAAYNIDPTIDPHATVAVIDAYGYPTLEADLAKYRQLFGLPACTSASGCLTILNDQGQPTPPTTTAPPGDDWTIETALDVDMVSAACPLCKIMVVEADDDTGNGLLLANDAAAAAGATVISNSWSQGESIQSQGDESHFTHAGVSIFAATGDSGEGNRQYGLPATSQHVIACGGTSIIADPAAPRGIDESAWNLGGSFCSSQFAQPSWQSALIPTSVCPKRATADVSAVADEQIPVINTNQEFVVSGTSASSPLVAAMFALSGNHTVESDYPYTNAGEFNDITAGSNGTCNNILCKTGAGWDGPTGNGTPMVPLLAGAKLPAFSTNVADGDTLPPGFEVDVTCTSNDSSTIKEIDVGIDGTALASSTTSPFSKKMPATLADGAHKVFARCVMSSLAVTGAVIDVTQSATAPPQGSGSGSGSGSGGGGDSGGGGCAAGGGGGAGLLIGLGVVGIAIVRRRRRS